MPPKWDDGHLETKQVLLMGMGCAKVLHHQREEWGRR